jgi:hypothetical protein
MACQAVSPRRISARPSSSSPRANDAQPRWKTACAVHCANPCSEHSGLAASASSAAAAGSRRCKRGPYFMATTTISTSLSGLPSVTPTVARAGGLVGSIHAVQASFISGSLDLSVT